MEMANQRIKFEVAWDIFDEVNEQNDTFQFIDLSCLDYLDAIPITKQKIFDLAKKAQNEFLKKNMARIDYILNIQCAEDHLMNIEDPFGRNPLKNCILEMIINELGIEYYYIGARRTILVRVDKDTLRKVPVFREQE